MDFFYQQDVARRTSYQLLISFVLLAIASAWASAYVIAIFIISPFFIHLEFIHPLSPLVVFLSALVGLMIMFKTFRQRYFIRQLHRRFDDLGSLKLLSYQHASESEHILLNITQEMSLASGIQVPRVFIMEGELGINALTLGITTHTTDIIITQPALERLTRPGLQALVAHSFAQIHNGDIQLNQQISAYSAGLDGIYHLGKLIFNSGFFHWLRIPIGLALMVIGYIGSVCACYLKVGFCRQRVLLADAYTVQFTRQTTSFADLLTHIHHHIYKSYLKNPFIEHMDHMCFAPPLKYKQNSLRTACHPNETKRLERWNQALRRYKKSASQPTTHPPLAATTNATTQLNLAQTSDFKPLAAPIPMLPLFVTHLTQPTLNIEHVTLGFICAIQSGRLSQALKHLDISDHHEVTKWYQLFNQLDAKRRIQAFSLIISRLRQLKCPQSLHAKIDAIIRHDGQTTLLELIYSYLIDRYLHEYGTQAELHHYPDAHPALAHLLALLTQQRPDQTAQWTLAVKHFNLQLLEQQPTRQDFEYLRQTLQQLNQLTTSLKKTLIDVCANILLAPHADTNQQQWELLYLLCEALNVPNNYQQPIPIATQYP